MLRVMRQPLMALVLCLPFFLHAPDLAAQSQGQELVDKARLTTEAMFSNPETETMRSWLKRARGVLIIPSLLKAGFLIGGEGGRGVLLGRDEKGAWSQPAFYSIGSGSFGLQIGFKDSQVMFVIMTESALKAMIDSKFKLGADASVAAGPTGVGVGGSTSTNVGADIYSFALNRGAFLGASFEGTIVVEEKEIEESYYGPGADARGIVLERRFANPASSALIRALSKN